MSLADEVLADHKSKSWPGAVDWCEWCTDKWPCESVRLATQLRAAEQVVTAARNARETDCTHHSDPCGLAAALDEYDKGDRQ